MGTCGTCTSCGRARFRKSCKPATIHLSYNDSIFPESDMGRPNLRNVMRILWYIVICCSVEYDRRFSVAMEKWNGQDRTAVLQPHALHECSQRNCRHNEKYDQPPEIRRKFGKKNLVVQKKKFEIIGKSFFLSDRWKRRKRLNSYTCHVSRVCDTDGDGKIEAVSRKKRNGRRDAGRRPNKWTGRELSERREKPTLTL